MWQRLASLAFLFICVQPTLLRAAPIPASDLEQGRSYYMLTAEVAGIGDPKKFQDQACPRQRGLLSYLIQNKISFSIHVSYQFGSRSGLIEQKELPILLVTNDGNKCTINFTLKEISPLFVPTQNLSPGRGPWVYPIKIKVAVKNDFEVGFINSLVSVASAAANFVGFQAGILTALTQPDRVQAQTAITTFFSNQFDGEKIVELAQYTVDFQRPSKTISITNLKLSGKKKIPLSLTLKLERRQSVISAQPLGEALKSASFGEWMTKPVSFKADKSPITARDIKGEIASLKTSDQKTWIDNCNIATGKLVNGQGLNHTDTSFLLARVILDENAEITKFDAPLAKLMSCPGKLYIGEIAMLGDDLLKLDENAKLVAREGREVKRQLVSKAVADLGRAWKSANKALIQNTLDQYLASEVSLEDTSLLLSPDTQFVGGDVANARQKIIGLLEGLKLSEFGCFGVPPSVDYTAANVYGILQAENAGDPPKVALMTWTLSGERLKTKSKFVTNVTLRQLDAANEDDRTLVQAEVLGINNCGMKSKLGSYAAQDPIVVP